jgi:PAS domain S-box-containing protein
MKPPLPLFTSEQRFRAIAETAHDLIFCKDEQRQYTYVNPAVCVLFGVQADDLLGRAPEEVFSDEDAQVVRSADDATFAGETVSEVRALEVAGRTRVYHTVQVPLRDGHDEVTGICGIVRDITARANAEEQQRRQQELIEAIIDSSFDGIHAFDDEYRLLEWNRGMERITGMTRDEVLGEVIFEVLPRLTLAGADRLYRRALAGEITRLERIAIDSPAVPLRCVVEANFAPLRGRGETVRGGVAVLREVSDPDGG